MLWWLRRRAVWKSLSGNPDEKHWRGQCVAYISPPLKREQAKHLGIRAVPYMPKHWGVQFAAAGLIAEEILDGINDPGGLPNVYTLE